MDNQEYLETTYTLPNPETLQNRAVTPSILDKMTYHEIFNSNKDAMKKPLNYINYSSTNYNLINNGEVTNVYD